MKQYRKADNAYYGGCNKDDIRDQLLREQGHLCAYCMRRIYKESMKIEHWYPEDRMTDQECLDFSNMFGCCPGHNPGDEGKQDTCDTHKKNTIIAIKPTNPAHIARIKYSSKDGAISSDTTQETVYFTSASGKIYEDVSTFQKDLDETLNLNEEAHYLKQGRKQVLEAVKLVASKKCKDKGWSRKVIQNIISKYQQVDENGCLKQYSGIIIWYFEKKLKQLDATK